MVVGDDGGELVVGDDAVVSVVVMGMVGLVIVGCKVVGIVSMVVGTSDDSVSFNEYNVNGKIIPEATSTVITSSDASKHFFLAFEQAVKYVKLFRNRMLSVIFGFTSISFLLILITLYFRIEALLINVPPFFLSISCSGWI